MTVRAVKQLYSTYNTRLFFHMACILEYYLMIMNIGMNISLESRKISVNENVCGIPLQ